jgi:hypothetical protein
MATTTFQVQPGADDGGLTAEWGATYPGTLPPTVRTNSNDVFKHKNTAPSYNTGIALLRWDTSALGAGVSVSACSLRFYAGVILKGDARNLNIEWFDGSLWPIAASMWADPVGTSAANVSFETLADGWNQVTLASLASINPVGFTALRLGVSGGAPSGSNGFTLYGADYYPSYPPQLVVTYTLAGYPHKVNGVLPANIASINGIPTANIAKVKGV